MSSLVERPPLTLDRPAERPATRYRATLVMATLTCALAPAYVIRFRIGPLPTTVLEVALLATLAVFALETWRTGLPAWRSPLAIPTGLFLVAGALSVAASPGRIAALGLYRAYFVEPILLALVLVTVVRTWRAGLVVVAGLWAGAAAVALTNLGLEIELARRHAFNATWMPQVVVYTSQNAVSLYLDPLVAVAGALVLHARDRVARIPAAVFLVIALPAEALSLSRAGWLALGAVAAGLALSVGWRWLLAMVVAAAGAGAALLASGRAPALFEAVKGDTLSGRIEMWQAALALLRQRPILGAGLTGYPDLIRPFWRHYDPLWSLHPHDIVLNFWLETGLLGLLAFTAIVAVTALLAWRGWRSGAPAAAGWRPLQLGVLLALLAVVVHGLLDVPYLKNDLSVELWALVAVAAAGARWAPAKAPE
ncbi:MAG TPA: O-antigen ligase family protein [Candidatus Dormibacteraeota bacterium]|nr:O-antigen ligase family protein [Candidatus Dormibacteraeota bacterium]